MTCSAALLWAQAGFAQGDFNPDRDISDREYEAAFDAYYADPRDIEAAVLFARMAIARGEWETAAGTLERILMIAPDLAVLRAELGMLYARLGSYDVAKHHLQKAIGSGQLDEERTRRAETLLSRAEKETSLHTITARIMM